MGSRGIGMWKKCDAHRWTIQTRALPERASLSLPRRDLRNSITMTLKNVNPERAFSISFPARPPPRPHRDCFKGGRVAVG